MHSRPRLHWHYWEKRTLQLELKFKPERYELALYYKAPLEKEADAGGSQAESRGEAGLLSSLEPLGPATPEALMLCELIILF